MEIAGYEIVRELGRGGMATVYLAIQPGFEREVAFKVLSDALSDDPTFSQRFQREARIVAHLSHPHIVAVYDVGTAGKSHFIAMEYYPGGDLADKLRKGISPAESVRIVREVAGALDYAHARGTVHRDIKPGNVLFGFEGAAVITDFGIAKVVNSATAATRVANADSGPDATLTQQGSLLGTPYYMSPEQARGHEIDGRSDLYSLGVMFYELLAGVRPYSGDDAMGVAVQHITEPVPELPEEFSVYQPILDRMLAKEPRDRFERGNKIVAALDAMASSRSYFQGHPEDVTVVDDTFRAPDDAKAGEAGSIVPPWLNLRVAASVVGAMMVMGSVPFLLTGDRELEIAEMGKAKAPSKVQPEEPNGVGIEPPAQDRELAALLALGETALSANRLTVPESTSAHHYFKQALALDPGNASAAEGLENVARQYVVLADGALLQGQVTKAEEYLFKADAIAPELDELAPLASKIADARTSGSNRKDEAAALREELRIDGLLRGAEAALNEGNWTTPKGANAYERYRQVLASDDNNQAARDGLEKLKDRLINRAQHSIEEGDLDAAETDLDEVSRLFPDNPSLGDARRSLTSARKAGG